MIQMLKRRRLAAVLLLTGVLLLMAVSISMALEASTPSIIALSPGDSSTVNVPSANISFTVTDPDLIAGNNYYIKLNGTIINSTFAYPGHWEDDPYEPWWVDDRYDQATISGTATGLKDGPQTVEVKAVDQLGNAVVKTWTFNGAVKPTISELIPASGSTAIVNNSISAKVTDNVYVDAGSITLVVDNNPVNSSNVSFNSSTGLVYYAIPAPGLANGTHTATITAKDAAGNEAITTWTFNVQAVGEPLTFADSGKTLTTAAPVLNVTAKSNAKLDSAGSAMTLDGKPVGVTFTYKGHWLYQMEIDPEWIIDSYNEATISGTPGGLKDGAHTLAVTAKDVQGQQLSQQWNFSVNAPPIFATPYPANGQTTTDNKVISVKVTDNDTIVPTSITIDFDGAMVASTFDAATGIIAYQPANGIANGNHTVKASAQDTTGNMVNYSWFFTVQVVGPEITFANDGQTFETCKPALPVAVKSNVKIVDTGVNMKIDGQPVNAVFTYQGHLEYPLELDPIWVVDSYNEGTLDYIPEMLNDGIHELVINAKDVLGNQSTKTFKFTVAQKPVFFGIEPVNGITTGTRTPTIKATVVDPNGTVDKELVKLLLDNSPVVPTITDTDAGINISYTTGSLAIDSYHDVSLTVTDNSGNSSTTTWKFYVNTKGDMPIGAKDCGSCHTLNEYDKHVHSAGPLGITVNNPSPTHFYGNACSHCHGGYNDKTCGYCHGANVFPAYDDATWVRPTPNPALSAGEDCLYCHSTNNGGWVPSSYSAYHFYLIKNMVNTGLDPIKPLYPDLAFTVRHDILPTHKIDKGTCNACHSNYLTREHNRKNRNGVQITCASCHTSTDPKVQQAIAAKNLDCFACHAQADHEAVHNNGLDSNCQTCHKGSLTAEHLNNDKTTAGKNYSCDTCHNSTRMLVQRAIAWDNVNCAGCHSTGHNMNFASKVPEGIPLYTGFKWTDPIEANIYTNEAATSFEYADGQVVISNRMTGVTAADIWSFYNSQLTSNSWIVKSGAPDTAATYFAATFTKDSRMVTIKCYNTENSDGTGAPLAVGYRVEIWIK